MELIHKLNGSVIDEPVGFDNFNVQLKRGEYHGMSAEVSVGDLEFYGNAYTIIKAAYDTDIDTIVTYNVTDRSTGKNWYSGVVDLSTCSFQDSEYRSVSCKVGEVGVKTTFNNRSETEVDLNKKVTISGANLASAPHWWTLYIPTKQLCFTNRMTQRASQQFSPTGAIYYNIISRPQNLPFIFDHSDKTEFGSINTDDKTAAAYAVDEADEFRKTYGNNCKFAADGSVIVDFYYALQTESTWKYVESVGTPLAGSTVYSCISASNTHTISARYVGSNLWKDKDGEEYNDIIAWNENDESGDCAIVVGIAIGNVLCGSSSFVPKSMTGHQVLTIAVDRSNLTADQSANFNVQVNGDFNIYTQQKVYFYISSGSKLRMKMYDTIQLGSTTAQAVSVFDALDMVAQHISNNAVRLASGFYNLPFGAGTIGDGGLKFITNGYKIRHLYTQGETTRSMPLSIKSMIEALNAMDCIGYALTNENGSVVLRVERWHYFYKGTTMLAFENVASVKHDVATDKIITEFTIGYDKYDTSSDYDSIDSIHGERTFISKIEAVSNALTKRCDWIADNYAIEETRRAEAGVDRSEEFKYDENIFVFEGCKLQGYNYSIAKSATNISGLDKPSELINAMLSPRHMAARWKDWLFSCNSKSDLNFSTGKINYDASFGVLQSNGSNYYNKSFADGSNQKESDAILNNRAIFDAEYISFDYPLTIDQYKSILQDPYRLISVNGELGWIDEFSFNMSEGTATFKLIKKHI